MAPRVVRAPSRSPAPPRPSGRQRRQPARRRQRQDAGRRAHRAPARRRRRAAGDPDPRLRAPHRAGRRRRSSPTGRACWPTSTRRRRTADARPRRARRRRRCRRGPLSLGPASPNASSAPPSTSSTMGFSTFSWSGTSICWSTSEHDLSDRPLPAGRLREPLTAAVHADAAIVDAGYLPAAERVGRALGVPRVVRVIAPPRAAADGRRRRHGGRARTLARVRGGRDRAPRAVLLGPRLGGMAARRHACRSAITISSRARDIARIAAAAKASAAAIVLTTDKDAVRFAACDLGDLPDRRRPADGDDRTGGRVPRVAARASAACRDSLHVRHWLEYVAVRALVAHGRADAVRAGRAVRAGARPRLVHPQRARAAVSRTRTSPPPFPRAPPPNAARSAAARSRTSSPRRSRR